MSSPANSNIFDRVQQRELEPHSACVKVSASSSGASDVFETHSNNARFVDVQHENDFLAHPLANRRSVGIPVQPLQTAFTGTIARGLSLVAIVIGGLMFAFGEGGNKRVFAGIMFGIGMASGGELS
jgi:hypothetical protein